MIRFLIEDSPWETVSSRDEFVVVRKSHVRGKHVDLRLLANEREDMYGYLQLSQGDIMFFSMHKESTMEHERERVEKRKSHAHLPRRRFRENF